MNLIITGGRGFIGANLTRLALEKGHKVSIIDAGLTGSNSLISFVNKYFLEVECKAYFCNINNQEILDYSLSDIEERNGKVDCLIHLAAETHVDRSISGARPFVETNVLGTLNVLEKAKERDIRVLHMSTDEVYGSLGFDSPSSKENDPFNTSSPYSASKAGAELLARSFFRTHKLPVVIARSSNNFGPYQFFEKLIPLMIKNALEDKPLPVYGEGKNIRDWLYVEDCAKALLLLAEKGKAGEVYNIGSGGKNERENIYVVRQILSLLKKPDSLIQFVEDRKGHDLRYSLCTEKIEKELGWKSTISFEEGLQLTILHYSILFN